MNKLYFIILVVVGAVLIVFELNGPVPLDHASSNSSMPGPKTTKPWLLLAGIGVAAFGMYRAWLDRSRHDGHKIG